MKDQWPLVITEAEVLDAELRLDFEFFANLIRYKQPIENAARERAADTVLRHMRGEITARQKGMLKTLSQYSKIAACAAQVRAWGFCGGCG